MPVPNHHHIRCAAGYLAARSRHGAHSAEAARGRAAMEHALRSVGAPLYLRCDGHDFRLSGGELVVRSLAVIAARRLPKGKDHGRTARVPRGFEVEGMA